MSISGKLAGGYIGANIIAGCYSWNFEEQADELDATTGSDGGYAKPDTGVLGGTVRISCYFDLTDGEYTPIRAGTTLTDLTLYDDLTGGTAVDIPTAVVVGSVKSAEVRGRLECSCTAKTRGQYTVNV